MMDEGPSRERHRGRHPADDTLFAPRFLPALRDAVYELSWLFERGYSQTSALKLVGDRHELRKRQRLAVLRSACGETARVSRSERKLEMCALAGRELWIDGFNCLITLEAALSGGVILVGRDRAHRDLSSVHGSYRHVVETRRALTCIADLLRERDVAAARWFLDRPVSNSGRLAATIRQMAPEGMDWTVDLVYNPDRELCQPGERVTATSDGWVLDRCGAWVDIPGAVIREFFRKAWLVDLVD